VTLAAGLDRFLACWRNQHQGARRIDSLKNGYGEDVAVFGERAYVVGDFYDELTLEGRAFSAPDGGDLMLFAGFEG